MCLSSHSTNEYTRAILDHYVREGYIKVWKILGRDHTGFITGAFHGVRYRKGLRKAEGDMTIRGTGGWYGYLSKPRERAYPNRIVCCWARRRWVIEVERGHDFSSRHPRKVRLRMLVFPAYRKKQMSFLEAWKVCKAAGE